MSGQTLLMIHHGVSTLLPEDGEGYWPVVKAVDRACSYEVDGHEHSEKFRKGQWDGRRHLFNRWKREFPTGLLYRVEETLQGRGFKYLIDDQRVWPHVSGKIAELKGITLRQHQVEAVTSMLVRRNGFPVGTGVVDMPPGTGKTEAMLAAMISIGYYPALWLTNKRNLLRQTYKRFSERLAGMGISVGIVGMGKWEPADITISTVQTLYAKGREEQVQDFLDTVVQVYSDECFPPGVMVDGKSIKDRRVGDLVLSYNHSFGCVEKKTVTRLFCRQVEVLLRLVFTDGTSLWCTECHPIFSLRGYVPASTLSAADMVVTITQGEVRGNEVYLPGLRERSASTDMDKKDVGKESLFGLRTQREACKSEEGCSALCHLWQCCSFRREGARESKKSECAVPQPEMSFKTKLHDDVENQSEVCLGTNASEKPYEACVSEGEGVNNSTGQVLETCATGGKRATSSGRTATAGMCSGVGGGSCSTHQKEEWFRIPLCLQIGRGQQIAEGWGGGGRKKSQVLGEAGTGQEEAGVLALLGVERVEIHKRGSSVEFDKVCPDGLVYNLEVEGNNNYFADDVLVHNCHHASADEWSKILLACPAPFRYGCSATPFLRGDGSDMLLLGNTGPLLYRLSPEEAEARGVISRPIVRLVEYDHRGYKSDLDPGQKIGHWASFYRQFAVQSELRNWAVNQVVQNEVKEGRNVLVLVNWIEHGQRIERRLLHWFDSRKAVRFIWGKTSDLVREETVEMFERGVLRVMIANSIFDEGTDIKGIDTVVIASAGNSVIKATQRSGRPRKDHSRPDRIIRVYDFVDRCHPKALRHTLDRMRAYQAGCKYCEKYMIYPPAELAVGEGRIL